ncbi:hypothetical protein [Burkholderia ubonensis]|uniref:hypothetical protein n=1 Tax=Burkholderia ubonensis TaxID=101571 RepID=UPI000AB04B1F|nr:hypothetical protein [Burkholderia ubonensis]
MIDLEIADFPALNFSFDFLVYKNRLIDDRIAARGGAGTQTSSGRDSPLQPERGVFMPDRATNDLLNRVGSGTSCDVEYEIPANSPVMRA